MCKCIKQPCNRHSAEANAKRRSAMLRSWADPKVRRRRKLSAKSPEHQANYRRAAKARHANPEYRARNLAGLRRTQPQRAEKHKRYMASGGARHLSRMVRRKYKDDPSYGERIRQALRRCWANPKKAKQWRAALKAAANTTHGKEIRRKTAKRSWARKSVRRLRIKGLRASYTSGHRKLATRNPDNRFHTGWVESAKSGRIFLRSSWEKFVFDTLNLSEVVTHIVYQPFPIAYRFRARKRSYFPDFFAILRNQLKILIEVKGYDESPAQTRAKIESARKYCYKRGIKFILLTGHDYSDFTETAVRILGPVLSVSQPWLWDVLASAVIQPSVG